MCVVFNLSNKFTGDTFLWRTLLNDAVTYVCVSGLAGKFPTPVSRRYEQPQQQLHNDVEFPSYRSIDRRDLSWFDFCVGCGFLLFFLFRFLRVCLPAELDFCFIGTRTTIQLPSTWLTHMECAKVPKIKLNGLDVSVSDISECLWGVCRRLVVCPLIYA